MDKLNNNALKKLRNEKGITLMVLIITIIVMVILLGVTVRFSIKGGVISSAEKAENSAIGKIEEGQEEIDKIIEEKNEATILDDAFVPQYIPQYTEENYSDGSGLKNYRIYGNSVQKGTPSPASPVEIQSVGDKTKNLLKGFEKGVNLDFTTGLEKTNSKYASTDFIPVNFNNNESYMLSGILNTLHSCVYAYNSNKEFLGRTSGSARNKLKLTASSFTSGTTQGEGEIAYLRISQYHVSGTSTGTIDDIDNAQIQLEEGTEATDYEPYGKYKIPVKARGKNLVNIPATTVTTSNKSIKVDLPAGKVYTVSAKIESNGVKGRIRFIYNLNGTDVYSSKANWITNGLSIESGFEIPEGATNIRVLLQRNTDFEGTFNEIMVVEGTQAAEYEPYIEPKTTNIYLDEPLRKIGDYADFIDFKNKRVVRNIKEKVFDNKLNWRMYSTSKFLYSSNEMQYIKGSNCYCTHYLGLSAGGSSAHADKNIGAYISSVNTNQLWIIDQNYTDVDSFLNNLVSQYEAGTPIKLYYPLAAPVSESINLPKINTIEGNNIITIDTKIQPSNVVLEF